MWNECNYTVVWTFFGLHPGLWAAGEGKSHRDTYRKTLEISSLPLTQLDFQESQGKYKILCDPIQIWLLIASFLPFPSYTLQTFLVWNQKGPKPFCPSDIFARWLQLCPTLWDLMDCGLPGSSVCGIFQARILEWVAISSSRGSSRPRDWTRVSWVFCIGRWVLYHCTTWEAQFSLTLLLITGSKIPQTGNSFGLRRFLLKYAPSASQS